jgi:hypothetical protein
MFGLLRVALGCTLLSALGGCSNETRTSVDTEESRVPTAGYSQQDGDTYMYVGEVMPELRNAGTRAPVISIRYLGSSGATHSLEEVDDSGHRVALYECSDPCRVMKVRPSSSSMRKEAVVNGSIIDNAFRDAFNGLLERVSTEERIPNTVTETANTVSEPAQPELKSGNVTSASAKIPVLIGECGRTTVESVSTRLSTGDGKSVHGSGSAIMLANGVFGVSYDQLASVDRSRRGDKVRTCLIQIPEDCPEGDDRGRVYKTTNLRTGESWTLPDASHMCGGA